MKTIFFLTLLILTGLSFVACSQAPVVRNSAENFLEYWEASLQETPAVKVARFKKEVVPLFPEFYEFKFAKWMQAGLNPDQELLRVLGEFPSIEAPFRLRSAKMVDEIHDNLNVFMARFPAFNKDLDIYITHSLGEMDGGVRTINGHSYFIFGVDSIVKYHHVKNEAPFFHHELFHVYHLQTFKPEKSLYSALWFEGLATYVSQILNPQASSGELLLDIPLPLVSACEKDLDFLLKELSAQLDSNSEAQYQRFFLMSSKDTRVPVRAGYYLGYRIVRKLSEKYNLDELVALKAPKLRAEIETAILDLQQQH